MYLPFNYGQINLHDAFVNPSNVSEYDNASYDYWFRSLFQRACSIIQFNLPEEWSGNVRDFFYYSLFRFGYVGVFNDVKYGLIFQPGTLSGQDVFYQYTNFLVANPNLLITDLKLGEDCELIKLCPDYMGIWDVISYYAGKLSKLDGAIDMSIINSKLGWILGAKNKAAAQALKSAYDLMQRGEPLVVMDSVIMDDATSKETPFQFLERSGLKNSYITTDLLIDFQTLIQNFDAEIGIPTLPYQKKERVNTEETTMRSLDGTARSKIWFDTLENSIEVVNKHFGTNITVELNYKEDIEDEQNEDESSGARDVSEGE